MARFLAYNRVYSCGGMAEKNQLGMELVKIEINDIVGTR